MLHFMKKVAQDLVEVTHVDNSASLSSKTMDGVLLLKAAAKCHCNEKRVKFDLLGRSFSLQSENLLESTQHHKSTDWEEAQFYVCRKILSLLSATPARSNKDLQAGKVLNISECNEAGCKR